MEHKSIKNDDISKLEESLAGTERELQTRYCQLGKSLLELASGEQRSVDSLVDRIIEIRIRLAGARRDIQCPDCMAYNTCDSRFCRCCGCVLTGTGDTKEDTHGTE